MSNPVYNYLVGSRGCRPLETIAPCSPLGEATWHIHIRGTRTRLQSEIRDLCLAKAGKRTYNYPRLRPTYREVRKKRGNAPDMLVASYTGEIVATWCAPGTPRIVMASLNSDYQHYLGFKLIGYSRNNAKPNTPIIIPIQNRIKSHALCHLNK